MQKQKRSPVRAACHGWCRHDCRGMVVRRNWPAEVPRGNAISRSQLAEGKCFRKTHARRSACNVQSRQAKHCTVRLSASDTASPFMAHRHRTLPLRACPTKACRERLRRGGTCMKALPHEALLFIPRTCRWDAGMGVIRTFISSHLHKRRLTWFLERLFA